MHKNVCSRSDVELRQIFMFHAWFMMFHVFVPLWLTKGIYNEWGFSHLDSLWNASPSLQVPPRIGGFCLVGWTADASALPGWFGLALKATCSAGAGLKKRWKHEDFLVKRRRFWRGCYSGATKQRNFKSQKDSRFQKRPWAGCYRTNGSTWIVDIPRVSQGFLENFHSTWDTHRT